MTTVATLRPGLLVAVNTSIKGNVHYAATTLEAEHYDEEGRLRARWETERTTTDPAEHEAAIQTRSKALSLIRSPCARSAFGLLCPEAEKDRLDKAVAEAQAVVDGFNATAKLTRVTLYVMTGRIAQDDAEAAKKIRSEIRGLMTEMELGIGQLDAEAVRDAAKRAKSVAQMLSDSGQEQVAEIVALARKTATAIKKAGETAAQEIDRVTIRRISEARTAFLDLDDAREIQTPDETGVELDLTPLEAAIDAAFKASPTPTQIEL